MDRFFDACGVFIGRPSSEAARLNEENLALKSAVAGLKMDLIEVKHALERLRSRQELVEPIRPPSATESFETLLNRLAAPLSQVSMQARLLETGRDVSGRSVMALARQIFDAVENAGLEPIGKTGEEMRFDPSLASPLNSTTNFSPGDVVIVRFIGYKYGDRVVRKALVGTNNDFPSSEDQKDVR